MQYHITYCNHNAIVKDTWKKYIQYIIIIENRRFKFNFLIGYGNEYYCEMIYNGKNKFLRNSRINFDLYKNELRYKYSKKLKYIMPILDKYQLELIELLNQSRIIRNGI